MATITIGDLEENQALDADAMRAVFGGKRLFEAQGGELSLRMRATMQFEESELIPGLLKTQDLRQLPTD